ncbi:MAG: sodium-dependent transporter [Chloroflexota bacterium]|nr:sodium-dependent transporter [Chloroflexota bacterium]
MAQRPAHSADSTSPPLPSEQWSSRFGFLMATIGSALGLGNIWRFPYVVGVSGGGAFLLPYALAILLCGLPVLVLELASGRRLTGGVVGAFQRVRSRARWVVAGWAIGYFAYGILGRHPPFESFTGGANSVVFFLVATVMTAGVVRLGVRRGIEATSKVLMPLLFLMLAGLAVYGVFLPGWGAAMQFYLKPDFSALGDALVWVRAFGQVFFSLGVGMGVMITYGSYMSRRENVPTSAAIVAVADSGAAFLAGLVIFPIVFSFGGEPGAGPKLAFDTLPLVFAQFPVGTGFVLAVLFYLLLTIAALTSSVSLLEMVIVAARETTGVSRARALYVLAPALALLGLPSALSYSGVGLDVLGQPFLDRLDTIVSTFGLSVGVLLTVLVLGWLAHRRVLLKDAPRGAVGWAWLWLVRLAAPAAIVAVLVSLALR